MTGPPPVDPERARTVASFQTEFAAVVANVERVIKGKGDVV